MIHSFFYPPTSIDCRGGRPAIDQGRFEPCRTTLVTKDILVLWADHIFSIIRFPTPNPVLDQKLCLHIFAISLKFPPDDKKKAFLLESLYCLIFLLALPNKERIRFGIDDKKDRGTQFSKESCFPFFLFACQFKRRRDQYRASRIANSIDVDKVFKGVPGQCKLRISLLKGLGQRLHHGKTSVVSSCFV